MGRARVAAALALEGYATVAVQVCLLRVVMPEAGSAVVVTGIALTMVLLGLGNGYRHAAKETGTGDAAAKAAGALVLGGALAVVMLERNVAWLVYAGAEAAGADRRWGTALYAGLAGFLPMHCFGRATAHLIGLWNSQRSTRDAGNALAWSCVGNAVAGLALAATVMQWAGVAAAIATIAIATGLGAAMLWDAGTEGQRTIRWVATGAVCTVALAAAVYEEDALYLSTAYADYRVQKEEGGGTVLVGNRMRLSEDDGEGRGSDYIEWMEDELIAAGAQRVAVLGGAGGVLGKGRGDALQVLFVDVDPAMDRVRKEVFPPARGEMLAGDARQWIRGQSGEGWDAIMGDTFSQPVSQPTHLTTREFFEEVRAALKEDGGVFAINLIGHAGKSSNYMVRVERTLRSVYADCTRWTSKPGGRWENRVYWCTRHPDDGGRTVYSDRTSKAGMDVSSHQVAW